MHKWREHFLKKAQEQIGKIYWDLEVIDVTRREKKNWKWIYYAICKCSCWKQHEASIDNLKSWSIKSCWCIMIRRSTLWLHKTRPYRIRYGMMRSCYSKQDVRHKRRWEKGIEVIDKRKYFTWRWEDNKKFYSENAYFTRHNPFKNFDKENCIWHIAYNISRFDLFDEYIWWNRRKHDT